MSGTPLTLVIVDDHELFTQGLILLLAQRWTNQFTVVGHADKVEEALPLVASTRPQIAVVDLNMPPLGGATAIRQIKKHYPDTRVLALSGAGDLTLAEQALRAGADGFMSKTASPDDLVAPLQSIAAGLAVIEPDVVDYLLSLSRKPSAELLQRLDDRDLKLWVLLARGLETVDIAHQLLVSDRTAKRLIASLLKKLQAANRTEAAGLAGQYGLLDDVP